MRKTFLTCGLILASTLNPFIPAKAEHLVFATRARNGLVYLVDLQERQELYIEGTRFVSFWLTTKGSHQKHRSNASCGPYNIESQYYGWRFAPGGVSLPSQTIGGGIARVACNF